MSSWRPRTTLFDAWSVALTFDRLSLHFSTDQNKNRNVTSFPILKIGNIKAPVGARFVDVFFGVTVVVTITVCPLMKLIMQTLSTLA